MFYSKAAGAARNTAEHDVCNIEHTISAKAFLKLKNFGGSQ